MAYRQADLDLSAVRRDGTIVHAHASIAGAPQKEVDPDLGRSRGDFRTRSIS